MSFGKPHRAVFCSSIVAVVAFVAAIPLYQMLVESQRPPEALTDLRFGKHGFILKNPNGGCVGWIRYELEYDGAYSFLFDGEIRYSLEGEKRDLRFKAGAGFNSLSQLTGTYVRVNHEEEEYQFRTEGVSPIIWVFEGPVGGKDVKIENRFKGPIEIYEPREGEFLIRSDDFPSFEQLTRRVKSATPLKPKLPFSPEKQPEHEGKELAKACVAAGRSSFYLDEFRKLLMNVGSLVFS